MQVYLIKNKFLFNVIILNLVLYLDFKNQINFIRSFPSEKNNSKSVVILEYDKLEYANHKLVLS